VLLRAISNFKKLKIRIELLILQSLGYLLLSMGLSTCPLISISRVRSTNYLIANLSPFVVFLIVRASLLSRDRKFKMRLIIWSCCSLTLLMKVQLFMDIVAAQSLATRLYRNHLLRSIIKTVADTGLATFLEMLRKSAWELL
jgi:hypothetical protein